MLSKLPSLVLFTTLAALAGCAGPATRDEPARLTYTWDAEDRATRLAFEETHEACTRKQTIDAYEACMIRNGFARADY